MTCKYFMSPDIKSLLPGKKRAIKIFPTVVVVVAVVFSVWPLGQSVHTVDVASTKWFIRKTRKRQENLNCQPEIFLACCVKCDTMFQLHPRARTNARTRTPLRCDITIELMVGIGLGKMKSHHHVTINTNTSKTWATLMLPFHYFVATETWLFFFFSSCFWLFYR